MRRNRIYFNRSIIPNLFTAMNMFSGFVSIVYSSQEKFIEAAWFIIAAALFDALDGFMARLTKSSSDLGVELDSLSDIVSFGAAPSFLIYKIYLIQFDTLGILIGSLIMIAGGFRLARFNVQLIGYDKEYFIGLPIPSAAITIAGYVLIYFEKGTGIISPYDNYIIPIVLTLAILMVSRIRYDTIPKFSTQEIKNNPIKFGFGLIMAILLIVTMGRALFYIFVFIILFGIFRHIYYKLSRKKS